MVVSAYDILHYHRALYDKMATYWERYMGPDMPSLGTLTVKPRCCGWSNRFPPDETGTAH